MCCCCTRLHRHQIHLISYGCVSFGLITTGLVFTIFAIFQKESQIGKVWLAGPTTMVVGLVLCGKVIIDWGPAMLHAREGSIDSRLMDQINNPTRSDMQLLPSGQITYEHEPKCNGNSQPPPMGGPYGPGLPKTNGPMSAGSGYGSSLVGGGGGPPTSRVPSYVRPGDPASYHDSQSCLIYSQYDHSINNINGFAGVNRSIVSPARNSSRPSSSSVNSPALSSTEFQCDCSQYGTMRRQLPPFQGESFVLNERSYLI